MPFKSKYFTCSCCGKTLQENRTNFVWFKNADENGNWHRTTCRYCEQENLYKENVKELNGLKLYKCSICGEWLPKENFYKYGDGNNSYKYRDGLDKRCCSCKLKQNKQAKAKYSDEKRLMKLLQERWFGARDRAKSKNIPFNIEKEDLKRLWDDQCGLCAISKIPMTYAIDSGRIFTNISIDQINPHLGYTKDNVQLVCMAVNQMKSDMSKEELYMFCEAILKNKNNELQIK